MQAAHKNGWPGGYQTKNNHCPDVPPRISMCKANQLPCPPWGGGKAPPPHPFRPKKQAIWRPTNLGDAVINPQVVDKMGGWPRIPIFNCAMCPGQLESLRHPNIQYQIGERAGKTALKGVQGP
jgi:hypothetical protein